VVRIGNYVVDRNQLPMSHADFDLVQRFHDLWYRRWRAGADTINLSWFGYHVLKCPLDLWIYQELLVRRQPEVVVETGTLYGGSALYLATILDHIGHGRVITVDIEAKNNRPEHPRISYVTGPSTDPHIVEEVHRAVGGARAMVILDSDHRAAHVFDEIIAYAPLVQVGDYLIVEDTNVNGHPTFPEYGPGPMEALERFLAYTDEFVSDERCERFMMTLNPKGYLRRARLKAPGPVEA
jgi:cephalosporin hydroxylase